MAASRDSYDGIPYELLPRDSAEVVPVVAEHLRTRRSRKESEHEFDIEPEWAVEATLDPAAHPPSGHWFVVTAWTAGRRQRCAYWKEHPDG